MIAYVNAHGTSTPAGDTAETKALKLALGEERAYQIPTSSTKSETGHLLGAAGALETIITALAMRDSFVPPTINQTDPDPDCDLDYVPNTGRAADVPYALTNSFGFGGHNAVIVLRRWDADAQLRPPATNPTSSRVTRRRVSGQGDQRRYQPCGDGGRASRDGRQPHAATPARAATRTTARRRWSRTCASARTAATTSR